jgi:hypothetical protein
MKRDKAKRGTRNLEKAGRREKERDQNGENRQERATTQALFIRKWDRIGDIEI